MAVVRFDAIKSVNFGSITNAYTPLSTPLSHLWRAICIVNATDAAMFISFNATDNNIFLPANSFRLYDVCANTDTINNLNNLVFELNTQIYIKYLTAPTSGAVYVEGIYARGQ